MQVDQGVSQQITFPVCPRWRPSVSLRIFRLCENFGPPCKSTKAEASISHSLSAPVGRLPYPSESLGCVKTSGHHASRPRRKPADHIPCLPPLVAFDFPPEMPSGPLSADAKTRECLPTSRKRG